MSATQASARLQLEAWLEGRNAGLSQTQWAQIDAFLSMLQDYNLKTNLTSDQDDALLLRHVADGLAALAPLRRRFAAGAPGLLDLGAGGGFVGVSLKVAWPQARVTLLESSNRKFRFLNLACARLGMPGLKVVLGRAPAAPGLGLYDAVLARALAPLPQALAMAMPLVGPGGIFIAYQSAPPSIEEPRLRKALDAADARLENCLSYRLPGEGLDRHLAMFRRVEARGSRLDEKKKDNA